MANFYIVLGYRTEHRKSEPVILAASGDKAMLQKAVDASPGDFLRFEIGAFQFLRKGRRSVPAPDGKLPMEDGKGESSANILGLFSVEEMLLEIERREGGLGHALKGDIADRMALDAKIAALEKEGNEAVEALTDAAAELNQLKAENERLKKENEDWALALMTEEEEAAERAKREGEQISGILHTTETPVAPPETAGPLAMSQPEPQPAPPAGEESPAGDSEGPELLPGAEAPRSGSRKGAKAQR